MVDDSSSMSDEFILVVKGVEIDLSLVFQETVFVDDFFAVG